MALLCRLLGHAALDTHHHNQGLDFALCERCGIDLIRSEGALDWDELPQGTRIVWRDAPLASDAAAVAARMARGPMPRRHRPRYRLLDQGRGAGERVPALTACAGAPCCSRWPASSYWPASPTGSRGPEQRRAGARRR